MREQKEYSDMSRRHHHKKFIWILKNGSRIDVGYLYEKNGYIYWDYSKRVRALVESNGGIVLKVLCNLKPNADWRVDLTTAKLPFMHPLNCKC